MDKYVLKKKLRGIPKGIVFEFKVVKESRSMQTESIIGNLSPIGTRILETYISLVGIDNKNSFEKVEQ